ncbi:uncharacterized protein LOC131604350 [Vicia villosa]|uniref:uncharacterized protein LOC131604350 n=1 Tax=Vicia villosa TaxID=3911 RepID=UPI00273B7C6C|nr:uncharacterized protein LOC131604350 [Vicia villosa]
MSVVVNVSPTKEFVVKRGLRQGDPLSPFLFVLVAEALARLVRKSIEIGEFENFVIKRSCGVDILQFADDTLLVGEGTWKHVKALKIVLRAFELVSGLGINFHKSKLIGINVSPLFLKAAAFYLSCKIEDSNLFFLGIPIGFNHRKESTWTSLLEKMKKRFAWWKNRFLNLEGRITLLKFILSSLNIFTMSFYKMPVKVVKEFNKIQSNLSWGSGGKEEHSLVDRRIVQGHKSLWFDVLNARYGDLCMHVTCGGDTYKLSSSSFWWRDILKVGFFPPSSNDPNVSYCCFKVGNGFNTPFWEASWLDNSILMKTSSKLFSASSLKKVLVAAMGGWCDGVWKWGDLGISDVGLGEPDFLAMYTGLQALLESFRGMNENKDSMVWSLDTEKGYTVSSSYLRYALMCIPFGPLNRCDEALELI